MRHTCFLFIGEEFADVAKGHKKYVLKYAGDNAGYVTTILFVPRHDEIVIYGYQREDDDDKVFKSDIDAAFALKQEKLRSLKQGRQELEETDAFLLKLFSDNVTLMMPGDGRMSLCIITSVSQYGSIGIIENICRNIESTKLKIDVDVLVYPHLGDVTHQSEKDSTEYEIRQMMKDTWSTLSSLKKIQFIRQVILMQDKNQQGITVTLNYHNLVGILGELSIAYAENFNNIFTSAMLLNNRDKITTFGLSQLTFDRYFHLQYLLRLTFIKMMERENVGQRDIDVNKVADIAKKCLMKHPGLLSEFYKKHVDNIMAGGVTDVAVMTKTADKMDQYMDDVKADLVDYIAREDLSLPEKRCVLAMILGEDDPLIVGDLYDTHQITFLDHYREPVNLFVKYNNSNIRVLKDEEGKTITDEEGKKETTGGVISHSIDDDGHAYFDLDKLKKLRLAIRQSTSFIRTKEDELSLLNVSKLHEEDSEKVITNEGFVFGGNVYKLIPDEPAKPVNETYKPKKTIVKNVNLSNHFTPIKNQGSIGSCSAHAVVSVFEHILKKNKRSDYDLSERFVFYNVRKKNDRIHLDEGISIYDAIKSIEEEGLCLEELCPYTPELINEPPTEDAYEDGKNRKVLKAMNIPIGDNPQDNVNALRSALSEGYPVLFGMRVFESFRSTDGFVMLPTEDEIASEDKNNTHAMVICGYDDEQKFFLVRNSWGTQFGVDGYCYLPYAYLGDKRLIHGTYIITEVSMEGVQVRGIEGGERFSFNAADNLIRAIVISNLITEERNKLQRLTVEYKAKRMETEQLIQQLVATNTRDDILQHTQTRLEGEISQEVSKKDKMAKERGMILSAYEQETSKGYLYLGLGAFALLLINFFWSYNWWRDKPWNIGEHTFILGVMCALCILGIIAWKYYRHYGHKHLKEDLDEAIAQQGNVIGKLELERDGLKSRFHVAGMLMTRLFKLEQYLNEYYKSSKSFVNNLSAWYDEERMAKQRMTTHLLPPFEMVFDEKDILNYFQKQKDTLLEGLHLYDFLSSGEYQVGVKSIIQFQKQLQDSILKCLKEDIDGFNIYEYVMRQANYPFLVPLDEKTLNQKLKNLDNNAIPFVQRVNPTNDVTSNILVACPQDIGGKGPWNNACSPNPNVHTASSPWSLTMIKIAYLAPEEITLISSLLK